MKNRVGVKLSTGSKMWFQPQEDITTFELSQVMIFFISLTARLGRPGYADEQVNELFQTDPSLRRHFEIEDKQ